MNPSVKVLVEVDSAEIRPINFTDRSGNPKQIFAQPIFVFIGGTYPERSDIIHNRAADALPPGKYFATRVKLAKRGVQLDFEHLTPAVPAQAKAG